MLNCINQLFLGICDENCYYQHIHSTNMQSSTYLLHALASCHRTNSILQLAIQSFTQFNWIQINAQAIFIGPYDFNCMPCWSHILIMWDVFTLYPCSKHVCMCDLKKKNDVHLLPTESQSGLGLISHCAYYQAAAIVYIPLQSDNNYIQFI